MTNTRYRDLNTYYKERFGEKTYKLSLNGGMTCPNRDGTIGMSGCIFCSEGGSGDFAGPASFSITKQIDYEKTLLVNKIKNGSYIAYFQAFTNTYAPVDYLRNIFMEAISHPDIVALSIGTRPDCLPPDVLALLDELNQIKPVFIELGLQTIHEHTAVLIKRGYPLSIFEKAVKDLQAINIPIVVHLILGLPGETNQHILESIQYLNKQPIHGIKLSLLHILKNTELATLYEQKPFPVYTLDEYTDLVIQCIEHLRDDIIIHRMTGDGPRSLLIAPLWSISKGAVLNTIHKNMKLQNSFQGKQVRGD